MSVHWRGDEVLVRLRNTTAEGLLLAAETFKANHLRRIGIQNPPTRYLESSKPGEYMKRRTGTGQDSLQVSPSTVAEAVTSLRIKVGFAPRAWYMVFLERHRNRLGSMHTLTDLKPLLRRLVMQVYKKA